MENSKRGRPSATFVVGSVALLFLIVGYQAALFITKASVARIVSNHDRPDTVFVYLDSTGAQVVVGQPLASRREAPVPTLNVPGVAVVSQSRLTPDVPSGDSERSDAGSLRGTPLSPPGGCGGVDDDWRQNAAKSIWRANTRRRYECFRFDPNTVSVDDLMRLGFSEKQALSIDSYRKKGGRFRRKTDFAKSYVVEDSVYKRLEKFIVIPEIDLNKADSAAFETLPGIGKFFAAKMVSYRRELWGYSYPEQLMDIWHFDQEKFDGLKDLITVGPSEPYPLWTLPELELARHPYIGKRAARGIAIFRENTPKSEWSVGNLQKAGILDPGLGEKLARCRIALPSNP
ncbi:MAG: helix-hairpin-helix domain-containing protein [Bacteroidales bacterium]|nr:helix-hairpin-helix domain-containing protein [Bacteroidales bacterium]